MARNPHMLSNKAQRAERKARVFALALTGMSQRAIGRELGVSATEVGRLINEQAEDIVAPDRDVYRQLQMEQYSDLIIKYKEAAEADHWCHSQGRLVLDITGKPMRDWEKTLRAYDRYMKALEAQARLLGLNAPAQVEQTHRTVSPVDDSIAALVAQMESKAADEQAALNQAE